MNRLIALALLLSACGQPKAQTTCAGPEIGTWLDNSSGQLSISSSCTFAETRCAMTGTFQSSGDTITLNVTNTNKGAYCLGTGPHTCTKYFPNQNEMYITCEGYTFGYAR